MPVNSIKQRQQDGVYRRGVLLGMTMAEIMILILFCLLMAFALRLDEFQEKLDQAETAQKLFDQLEEEAGSFDDAWTLLSDMQVTVQQFGSDVLNEIAEQIEGDRAYRREEMNEAITFGLKQYGVVKEELTQEGDEDQVTPDMVIEAIKQRMDAGEKYVEIEPVLGTLDSVKDSFEEATGREPSPDELGEEFQRLIADAAAWQAAGRGNLAEEYQAAVMENEDLKERMGRLDLALNKATDQLAGKGQGLEYPSCFQTTEGKTQYVFDIEFDEETMTLQALPVPGNELRWEKLNFDRISTGEPLEVKRYLAETIGVFKWSKENACNFFVRILDRTLAENKSQYKRMKRYIEYRFYTWESPKPVKKVSKV